MQNLNRYYYNMPIAYRKNAHEIRMLLNVHKRGWQEGLRLTSVPEHHKLTRDSILKIKSLAAQCEQFITTGHDEDDIGNVGRANPAKHLQQEAEALLNATLDQGIGSVINAMVF